MKYYNRNILNILLLLKIPFMGNCQLPNLGKAKTFTAFTSIGAFTNTGASHIRGDIGTNAGALAGFPPGTIIGNIYIGDSISLQASIDINNAYHFFDIASCDSTIGTLLGDSQILTPNIYYIGAVTSIDGILILDAQGDSNSIFIFKIDAAFSTNVDAKIVLRNGGNVKNIFWQINGTCILGERSTFIGTALVNGAITILEEASVIGRTLSIAGAVAIHNSAMRIDIPTNYAMYHAPITLQISIDRNYNKLSWRNYNPELVHCFIIEKLNYIQNFTELEKIIASSYQYEYYYTDLNTLSGLSSYRIAQVGNDSTTVYSEMISINNNFHYNKISIFPNPASNLLNIEIPSDSKEYLLYIYNSIGQLVSHNKIQYGNSTIYIQDFIPGLYNLQISSENILIQNTLLTIY